MVHHLVSPSRCIQKCRFCPFKRQFCLKRKRERERIEILGILSGLSLETCQFLPSRSLHCHAGVRYQPGQEEGVGAMPRVGSKSVGTMTHQAKSLDCAFRHFQNAVLLLKALESETGDPPWRCRPLQIGISSEQMNKRLQLFTGMVTIPISRKRSWEGFCKSSWSVLEHSWSNSPNSEIDARGPSYMKTPLVEWSRPFLERLRALVNPGFHFQPHSCSGFLKIEVASVQ